jgi:sec-independent protein translocase protein TatC
MAAILTPTPDIFNMAMMGVPLYVLYEAGIIIAGIVNPPSTYLDKA